MRDQLKEEQSDQLTELLHEAREICIDEEKLETIKNWKLPQNKTQLKSFLGFVNFFDHFLPNHSELASPLTDMLTRLKPDKLVWGEREIKSLESLKLSYLE